MEADHQLQYGLEESRKRGSRYGVRRVSGTGDEQDSMGHTRPREVAEAAYR